MSTSPIDHRFARLRTVLASSAPVDPALPSGHSEAAVSLILRSRVELELLLIKRAEAPNDPWSGHMALPGGKREPGDTSLLHTAVRETLEETGLALGTNGEHLGRLSRLDPSTRRLPPLTITPFVFGVDAEADAHTESPEVERVFWVPLTELTAPDAVGVYRYRSEDLIRRFPAFMVDEHPVWGLTYRVLDEFLAKLP